MRNILSDGKQAHVFVKNFFTYTCGVLLNRYRNLSDNFQNVIANNGEYITDSGVIVYSFLVGDKFNEENKNHLWISERDVMLSTKQIRHLSSGYDIWSQVLFRLENYAIWHQGLSKSLSRTYSGNYGITHNLKIQLAEPRSSYEDLGNTNKDICH